MTNIIKRIISKRSKVRTYEYTGDTVSIPKTITHVQFHPSVTEVQEEAFKDCNKLKEVVLSDNITKIGNGSFQDCTKLKHVVLNHGLTIIGHDAFAGCSSIKSITFPSTVIKIGDRTFKDCSSLKQIEGMRNDVNVKYGWDALLGCPFEKFKVRLDKISDVSHLKELETKIDEIDGITVKLRDHHLIETFTGRDMQINQESSDRIDNLIQYYEVKEATSLVELALWKSKIDQADKLDRGVCRIELPELAKDLILQYAYDRIPLHTTTYIQIYIKCSRRVSPSIMYVEPIDTIAEVKKQIYENKDITIDRQQLFFRGELLNDDLTLADCNIQNDSTILLFVFGD